MSLQNALLVPLVDAGDAAVYGAKAANLARMLALGYAVPPGYALSNHVFQAHLQRAGLVTNVQTDQPAYANPARLERGGDNISDKLLGTPFDEVLASGMRAISGSAHMAICAVRSSAIGEDSTMHSFAGQLDTILNVKSADGLQDAVAKVWASMWSPRCLQYQQRRGLSLDSMGVILQSQVDACHAGVMFTRAPTVISGARPSLVIEYCNGLGERLVAGEADPARVLADLDDYSIISHTAGEDSDSLLQDSDISTLINEGMRLQRDFGVELDIEWAIDNNGKLWMLQARPITAAVQASPSVFWSNANIAENFPEPVSPFLYSVVRRGYAAYFRNLGLGFGISRQRIAAMHDALEHIVGIHGGRIYYNLSNIHTVISLAPAGSWLIRSFNQFVGATQFPSTRDLPAQGRIERSLELVHVALITCWRYLHVHAGLARFEHTVDAFCERTRPAGLALMPVAEQLGRLREFFIIRLQRWNDAALADTAAMVCYSLLQRQLHHWLPATSGQNMHNNLLIGLPGLASHTPVEKLWDLSRQIRNDPELAELFVTTDISTIARQLREQSCFADFLAELNEYLKYWGFRSSGELMLTRPSPEENPHHTLELLRNYAALSSPSPQQQLQEQAEKRERSTRLISEELTPNVLLNRLPFSRAWRFRLLLSATQGAVRLRERARQKQAKLYVCLRHLMLAIGQRLCDTGQVSAADDIFYLDCEEVDALLSGHAMFPYQIKTLVQQRREEHKLLSAMTPADNFTLDRGAYLPQLQGNHPLAETAGGEGDLTQLRGIGACGGHVTANAVVLADASEAGQMQQGDIVVTRQTDPGWACVFFLARGLVIERGGMLSHGAIIARELGIPAVIGVRNATARIANGNRLAVDGDRGVVDILS